MTKIHIISDLFLGANEPTPLPEQSIPDVDLVIFNGNLAPMIKRSMFYIETLCNKYPDVQFVCNLGQTEKYGVGHLPKHYEEINDSLKQRQQSNSSWPKNLHWSTDNMIIKLRNGSTFDILTTFGFPKIHSFEGAWEEHFWWKYIITDVTYHHLDSRIYKPETTSNVPHGCMPVWATKDWVNQQHELELTKIRKWELTPSHYKILVTHINPYKDARCERQITSPYLIHLNNMLWVSSNTKQEHVIFLGARLVTNPGRGELARRHVVTVNA
jgi:hypothetical protein